MLVQAALVCCLCRP